MIGWIEREGKISDTKSYIVSTINYQYEVDLLVDLEDNTVDIDVVDMFTNDHTIYAGFPIENLKEWTSQEKRFELCVRLMCVLLGIKLTQN